MTVSKEIDPRENLSLYNRRNAEKEVLESVYGLIGRDARFQAIYDRLWENAMKNCYGPESIDKLYRAFTSRASTLLPSIIKKARIEALKGMGKRVKEEKEEPEEEKEVRSSTSSSNRGQSQPTRTRAGEIPKGMSNRDYLMSD